MPGVIRPGFGPRLVRSLVFLVVLALDAVLTTALTGVAAFGGHSTLTSVVAWLTVLLLWPLAERLLRPVLQKLTGSPLAFLVRASHGSARHIDHLTVSGGATP